MTGRLGEIEEACLDVLGKRVELGATLCKMDDGPFTLISFVCGMEYKVKQLIFLSV
jgi:hypothetical protein